GHEGRRRSLPGRGDRVRRPLRGVAPARAGDLQGRRDPVRRAGHALTGRARAACLLAAVLASGCACSSATQAHRTDTACLRLTLPPARPGEPVALIHDVAAFPSEFLLGWPADVTLHLVPAFGAYGQPNPFGHGLLITR